MRDRKINEEYIKKPNILTKMRDNKCNAYTVKVTLGYNREKSYDSVTKNKKQ